MQAYPCSGVTTTSRAGRARRNPSFPARPSPFHRARLEFLWPRQLVFFFFLSLAGALVEFAAAVAHSHSKDEASPAESRTESRSRRSSREGGRRGLLVVGSGQWALQRTWECGLLPRYSQSHQDTICLLILVSYIYLLPRLVLTR